ncbi:MAG: UPF0337 protein [Pirellulaceae bacterium]|nr:MAG: UPF0337 protein [Pirellulaceae bacterium]
MVNEQTVRGDWNQIKGEMRNQWGQLTDDELDQARGNVEKLIGIIQRKTGEAREAIEQKLSQWIDEESLRQAMETARQRTAAAVEAVTHQAEQIGEKVREGVETVSDQARAGYIQLERGVRRRPMQSVATSFGIGVVVGVITGLLLRR